MELLDLPIFCRPAEYRLVYLGLHSISSISGIIHCDEICVTLIEPASKSNWSFELESVFHDPQLLAPYSIPLQVFIKGGGGGESRRL